ncbi:MAG: HEAT repeat domain-containing protein [Kiritimatiellae bacterium]|nr:HEAT repeat domain-containing protein [Kiritimatiellia bacterium]MDD5521538.1 HEAT repeat domain-containing protein [Kiritimatiellia bacterium]
MKSLIFAVLIALGIILTMPLYAADLSQLIADAAKYESGQSVEPLQKIEQLIRDSVGKSDLQAELETAMIKLLTSNSTFEARRFACQQLAVIGTDASLPVLAELLKNEETAGIACLALSCQRLPKAVEILSNTLTAVRGRSRIQLIIALGNHRDMQSVRLLTEMVRDTDTDVACAAIIALSKIADKSSCESIAALRKEAKPAIAWAVIDASLRVAEKLVADGDRKEALAIYMDLLQPTQPINIQRGVLAALFSADKHGAEKRILDVLHGSDSMLKPVAIAAVGLLKSRGASKKFMAELPKLQPCEQAMMIEALASRGDGAAVAAIREKILSSDVVVRRSAIAAIGKLDGATSVPLLCQALGKTQDDEEIQAIGSALSDLKGGKKTNKIIMEEMKRATGNTRSTLISVIAKRCGHAAVPVLIEETAGTDVAPVKAAFHSLARFTTGDDLPVLLERLVSLKIPELRSDAESAVVRTMARIENISSRTDVVCAALDKNSNNESRCMLLRLLLNCADAKALATLKAALKDSNPDVRETAIRTLTDWPDNSAWDTLIEIRKQAEKDLFRTLALRGLVRLATKQNATADTGSMDRYRQLFANVQNDDERKLVLSALAGAVHPDALQLALPLLSNSAVRAEAELAVKKIAAAIKDKNPQAAQDALKKLKTTKP